MVESIRITLSNVYTYLLGIFSILLSLKLLGMAIPWFWVFTPLTMPWIILLFIYCIELIIYIVKRIYNFMPGRRMKE